MGPVAQAESSATQAATRTPAVQEQGLLHTATKVALLQSWGDILLLQGLLGQFNTTGAYYSVVSSASFLSILWTPAAAALYPALSSAHTSEGPGTVTAKLSVQHV